MNRVIEDAELTLEKKRKQAIADAAPIVEEEP
jgi:hypothetical protein